MNSLVLMRVCERESKCILATRVHARRSEHPDVLARREVQLKEAVRLATQRHTPDCISQYVGFAPKVLGLWAAGQFTFRGTFVRRTRPPGERWASARDVYWTAVRDLKYLAAYEGCTCRENG